MVPLCEMDLAETSVSSINFDVSCSCSSIVISFMRANLFVSQKLEVYSIL